MRNILLLLLALTPLVTCAQKTFNFTLVNADTGKPMVRKWITVLQNESKYITFTPTDSLGICRFTVSSYDSTATFQAEISNHWNNYVEPGFFDITSVKTTIPVLKIKPSKFTLPFGCGTVMYPNYYPREPFSLHELPEAIQAKIKTYFIERVGGSFYKNIVLNGGQLVDLKAFYKLNPQIKKKEWEPPAFSLCFMVWDTETRQSLYNFQLEMDADGKLKKLIPLPDIIHYPAKAQILKLIEAKAIAKTYGFDKPYTQTKAYYYPKAKSIVWEFEYHDQGEGELVSSKLLIDAHSGKIADRLSSRITVNY